MTVLKHKCSECDSKFKIEYDERVVEDNPAYCPFCGTYIQESEMEQDEDY
jgi:DNA-directed RNA polymerase subunit RPC12/RpoP